MYLDLTPFDILLLDAVLDYAEIDAGLMELFGVYQSQALDPNVNRKRLMDKWRA